MDSFKKVVKELKNKITNSNSINKIIIKKNQFLDWVEVHPWKTLLILYFVFVVIKIMISQIYIDPICNYDEYYYSKMARSFWYEKLFIVNGEFSHQYPPLYPMAISPSYFFDDMVLVTRAMMNINALISSLIIFPAFLLSKEFLDTKKSLFISIIVSGMVGNMSWVFHIYSENLYYPLFLFTIFFIYKSLLENGYKFKIISGIFIGLCFLTRYLTIALFPAMLLVFIIVYYYLKNVSKIKAIFNGTKDWLITSITAGIIILPWMLRNGSLFGFTISGMLGYRGEILTTSTKIARIAQYAGGEAGAGISLPNYSYNFIVQALLHHGFLILGSGIIFFGFMIIFLYTSSKTKERKILAVGCLTFITIEFYILLTAWHGLSKPWYLNGRYVESFLPLIIIIGYVGISKRMNYKNLHKILIFLLFPMLMLTNANLDILFRTNNLSISPLVVALKFNSYLLHHLEINSFFSTAILRILSLITLICVTIFFIFLAKKKYLKVIKFIAIALILSITVANCTVEIFSQKNNTESELYEIGNYLNLEISGKQVIVLFDKNTFTDTYGCKAQRSIGSWINAPIVVKDVENNSIEIFAYLITSKNLNYSLFHQFNLSNPGQSIDFKEEWNMTICVYDLRGRNET